MKQFFKRCPAPIPVLCYAVAILGYLICCLLGLAADELARAKGTLTPIALTAADFQAVGLTQTGETTWLTVDGDPQLVWHNAAGITVRSLRFAPEYDRAPREICLYYTTREGEAFSLNKRVFPAQQNDGSYVFRLPRTDIAALRLDPSSPVEEKMVTMTLAQDLLLNQPAAWWQNFAPGWAGAFGLIVYPGLAAAFFSLLRQGCIWYFNRRPRPVQ